MMILIIIIIIINNDNNNSLFIYKEVLPKSNFKIMLITIIHIIIIFYKELL